MTLARTKTKQRRAAIERRARVFKEPPPIPLQRQVVHAICSSVYNVCACRKALDKTACERMEGAARYVIDLVRNGGLK